MEKRVSIILPTYNVERYLEKCLDSVLEQTYKNIEIIVVDDGSTDSSLEIAKRYKEKDERIKVLTQENKGSGPARNLGLEHAIGEYCIFVDPDDWIDDNLVEKLLSYQSINDYDLVATHWKIWDRYGKKIRRDKFTNVVYRAENTEETRKLYLKLFGLDYLVAPTTKLYKMSIIKENNISFPDLRRSQDIVFNYRYYECVKSVYAIDCGYYNYRFDNKNNFNKVKKDYFKTLERIYDEIMMYCQKMGIEVSNANEDYVLACNYLLGIILLTLQANCSRNESIKDIVESKQIQEIARNSKPTNLFPKLVRNNLVNQNYTNLHILLKTRVFIKNMKLELDEKKHGLSL